MSALANGTVLVCIDMQEAILAHLGGSAQPAIDAALDAMLGRVARVQNAARCSGVPVVHVQHDGAPGHRLARGTGGWRFRPEVAPLQGEHVVHKQSCDAFHETDLANALADARHIVVAGCMTQYCVDTTCRRAVSLGYDVTLVADGHSNAGSSGLTCAQVIAHHNAVLDGFGAGAHSIRLALASALLPNSPLSGDSSPR